MDIDGPVEDRRVVAAVDLVEELITREDPPAGLEQDLKESEFDPGQRDDVAVAQDFVARGVEDEVGVADEAGSGSSAVGSIAPGVVRPRAVRSRIRRTRTTSSAGLNGFGR